MGYLPRIEIKLYLKKDKNYIISKEFNGNYFANNFDKPGVHEDLEKMLLDSNCEVSTEKSTLFVTDFWQNLHINRIKLLVSIMNKSTDSFYEIEIIETVFREARENKITTSYHPKRI